MVYFKYLLIFSFCVSCSCVVKSTSLNETRKSDDGIDIDAKNSVNTNYSLESEECDCGENSIRCEITSNGRKKCTCEAGYSAAINIATFKQECRKCDCGLGVISCTFTTLQERKCICRKGYAPYYDWPANFSDSGEKCKRCDCGEDEISCSFDSIQRRKCECGGDSLVTYGSEGQSCKKCNCGIFSVSCRMKYGHKKCTCEKGYFAKTLKFNADEECVKNAPERTETSVWRIGTYIVAIIYCVIFTGLLILIKQKRKN